MVRIGKRPRKEAARQDRLPNAPLVEVVFELRWKLRGNENLPAPLRSDPGTLPLLHTFPQAAAKLGFVALQQIGRPEEIAGHSIIHRYRKDDSLDFPLWQIGVGIFAANDGPQYEWKRFKNHVLTGAKAAIQSYPNLPGFPLEPEYLELRYIDLFDETLLNTTDLAEFSARGTTLKFAPPPFLADNEKFEGSMGARAVFIRKAKSWEASNFSVDFGTVLKGDKPSIRLETKVLTHAPGVPTLKDVGDFLRDLESWLEFAHGITSPFFRNFVSTELRTHFELPPNA